jgi:transcriptional regulator with XRE-family HTH domain
MKNYYVYSLRKDKAAYALALSRRLRAYLVDKTAGEIAEAVGVCDTTVRTWLRNVNPRTPDVNSIADICSAFDIDANELLGVERR